MRHLRVVVARYGGPEVITAIEEDAPTPNPGEVPVKAPRLPYTPGGISPEPSSNSAKGVTATRSTCACPNASLCSCLRN